MQIEQIGRLAGGLSEHNSQFLAGSVNEELVVSCLQDTASRQGYRVAARVNLWQYVDRRLLREGPDSVLKGYKHPLQPDIDLLVENPGPDPILSIHEVKVIRWNENRRQPVAPKGRLYEGVGQALALTTFGADYCYLWHVWVHPRGKYRVIAEQSVQLAERLEDGWVEYFTAYGGLVKGLFSNFALPLGYVFVVVIMDVITNEILITPFPDLWKAAERLPRSQTGLQIRELLMKALA